MSNDETTRPVTGSAPTGYPHPFPPPQQGYYGQPNTTYPNYYNGAGPPPGTVYYSPAQLPNNPSNGYKFVRLALIIMIVLMVCTITFSLFTKLFFGPGFPDFKVASFDVPYFDTTNSTLKARWETNMSVKNKNQKLRISFTHIQGYLVYRNRLVDNAMIDPLHLEGKNEGTLRATFILPYPGGNLPEASVVNAMGEGRKFGILEFYLRLDMRAIYVSGPFWSREIILSVICGDLRVNFPAPTGGGTWSGTGGECSVHY